ncbi:uncharacterized protein KY384_006801 [Bacidia gigantensis]|uniref:uncharacterized protein n=1 Tax=Bacidia gigantensis TaxID=2732470 RepID=UPI001D045BB0|nr:uncharacterized protein KY384_006801 [Bacidia gigantensis]KAG8527885.1 hypothetical protein KY384_006801 [Bacidia gigantensis]
MWLQNLDVQTLSCTPYSILSDEQHRATPIDSLYLSAFYASFWPSHPFLPPLKDFKQHLKQVDGADLAATINYIGSLYVASQQRSQKGRLMPQPPGEYSHNAFTVQNLLLLAITYHMQGSSEEAQDTLSTATRIAIRLGLNQQTFSAAAGNNVTGESWRRTWWELYVLNILFAALNQSHCHGLEGVETDVPMPCEEHMYREFEKFPIGQSLADFQDSLLSSQQGLTFSSFTYRIAAARALNQIIGASTAATEGSVAPYQAAELALETLRLRMGSPLQSIIDPCDFSINEMLFQAQMLVQAGTIFLHKPRSGLEAYENTQKITCAPESSLLCSDITLHHTKKCVDAADELCKMVSVSGEISSRTPLFVCAMALQSLVHLGAYNILQWSQKRPILSQQVQLSVSGLQRLGQTWITAQNVGDQVSAVARAVLNCNPDLSHNVTFPSDDTPLQQLQDSDSLLRTMDTPNSVENLSEQIRLDDYLDPHVL